MGEKTRAARAFLRILRFLRNIHRLNDLRPAQRPLSAQALRIQLKAKTGGSASLRHHWPTRAFVSAIVMVRMLSTTWNSTLMPIMRSLRRIRP
jgi:hypothetical protein